MQKFLLAVSGPSGAGKGTILAALKNQPEKYQFSVSYTTRAPRPGEITSHHYHFITENEFKQTIVAEEFLEYEIIHHNYYGTKRKDLEQIIESGKIAVLEIDVKGVANLRKNYTGQIVSVFIEPPSLDILTRRLRERGTEDAATVQLRVSRYQEEMKFQSQYDYVIINDTVEQAQKELLEILKKEHGA